MKFAIKKASLQKEFNWKIAGKAGEGVMVVSKLLAKVVKRHGWYAFSYLEYPSLIKGGHQTGQVRASAEPIFSQKRTLDFLIAFSASAFEEHKDEISKQTIIIYNADAGELDKKYLSKGKIVSLPLIKLAQKAAGAKMVMNVVAFGASTFLLGLDKKISLQILREEFADKGKAIVKKDTDAFNLGYETIQQHFSISHQIKPKADKQILLTGNEAVGLGAVAAGMQFYSAYPMTPASGLMHYLAEQQFNFPLIVKHAEDEIAAINHAIGASFAGVRAMTGTSGGGFALMVEGLSLAGVTELPLVILYAQRPGPATGLPTWTSQADLQFVLHAGHGEFQRIVLTPGTVEEHYLHSIKAFELAEKYQIPVFILSDKFILESHQTMQLASTENKNKKQSLVNAADLKSDNSYRRYQVTKTGLSPRSIPGQPHGLYIANSYEHDEFGFATEDAKETTAQIEKRARKVENLADEVPQPILYGAKKAPVTFVGWGSTANVLLDVVKQTDQANFIHLPCVWPFPKKTFAKLAKTARKLVMVEGNATGQAEQLIFKETGIAMADHLRRYDGRPFYVSDILAWLKGKK